jgi:ADP-heptose:LPS heptosyltransferase
LSRAVGPWRALAAATFYAARVIGALVAVARPGRHAIALIRTDGAGDAILSEPLIRALARQFDRMDVHLWAPAGAVALLESHEKIQKCVVVPRGFKEGNAKVFWSLPWRARLGYRLGRHRYDIALYSPDDPEPLGSWLLAQMRADEKWLNRGSTNNQFDWQRDWAAQFATRLLEPRPDGGHELQRAAHLAEQLDLPQNTESPNLPLSPRALTYASVHVGAARHAVRRARAGGLIGIIPAGSAAINQYPLDKWSQVIRRLWEQHTLLPALLGGPQDEILLQQLSNRLADVPHHKFPTDCDIAVSAAVVSRLDGLISVDTGLAHAATAFDLPTVVLVTGGMPGRFWPWPAPTRTIALTKPMPCAGCSYRCTQESAHCITDLSPDWIVDALLRAMKSNTVLVQAEPERLRRAS